MTSQFDRCYLAIGITKVIIYFKAQIYKKLYNKLYNIRLKHSQCKRRWDQGNVFYKGYCSQHYTIHKLSKDKFWI